MSTDFPAQIAGSNYFVEIPEGAPSRCSPVTAPMGCTPALIEDLHAIPGFWKIDGYTRCRARILERFEATPGDNFFEFPYDWRRDNRHHARRL
ncbi:MAG TPA: hypothetical protein PKK15_08240, partial [Kouleothrix sp.]|nr:hypothetical protein [Kouleothrix sp.]